ERSDLTAPKGPESPRSAEASAHLRVGPGPAPRRQGSPGAEGSLVDRPGRREGISSELKRLAKRLIEQKDGHSPAYQSAERRLSHLRDWYRRLSAAGVSIEVARGRPWT